MSSLLDKSHPFRANVDTGSAEKASNLSSSQSSTSSESKQSVTTQEKDSVATSIFKAFSRLKPKTRLAVIAIFGVFICYSYLAIYDALFGVPAEPKTIKQPSSLSIFDSATQADAKQKASLDDEYSEDKYSYEQPSWLERKFCTGVKRTFFCD